jgi:threonine dehydratase
MGGSTNAGVEVADAQGITAARLDAAYTAVRRIMPPTPLLESPYLSARLGRPVWLKLESVTPARAFKVRGAIAKVAELEAEGRRGPLVTASAGNHGLAVAFAGRCLSRQVTVFVPAQANPTKVAAMQAQGAEVIAGGRTFRDLWEKASVFIAERRAEWVHPFDDPAVIAGQASVGREIAEVLPEVDKVVVPIGGGGLASGIGTALAHHAPGARLVGVQVEGADSMVRSLAAGHVVTLDRVDTVADGLAPGTASERTLSLVGAFADTVLRLKDDELFVAMRVLIERERVLAEPSGAAGVAAVLAGPLAGSGPVCVVVTGGNVAMRDLARAIETPLPADPA